MQEQPNNFARISSESVLPNSFQSTVLKFFPAKKVLVVAFKVLSTSGTLVTQHDDDANYKQILKARDGSKTCAPDIFFKLVGKEQDVLKVK
mmetsp:Transcript_17418/g.43444  ORF Transcript_17418/g.43444 Transcript_17418/m.43444 type:complete len:91 (+) Transcript_17418:779-1051(+)